MRASLRFLFGKPFGNTLFLAFHAVKQRLAAIEKKQRKCSGALRGGVEI